MTPEPEIPTTEEEDRKRAFASTRIQALLRGHLARTKTTAADVTKATTTSDGDTAVPEVIDTTEKTQPNTADVADDIQMEDPPGSQGESQEKENEAFDMTIDYPSPNGLKEKNFCNPLCLRALRIHLATTFFQNRRTL